MSAIEDALASLTAELRELHAWADGYLHRHTGMGAGLHVEMWPMLGPSAAKELSRRTERWRALIEAPGVRDPEVPCTEYAPGEPTDGGCEGDGHHLCRRCVYHAEAPKP